MIIDAYKTHKITVGENLYGILDKYLPKLEEKSVVVVTSKIVSLCQGTVIKNDGLVDKKELIKKEADLYLEDPTKTRYGTAVLTIKNNILIWTAGIDESNTNGYFALWPKNIQETAGSIWKYLRKKHALKKLGVIITDSRLIPLRRGPLGFGLGWCGFRALNNYIGKEDLFGRKLQMTKPAILDGLSAAAVVVMGEGKEQTPLATIMDVPFVQFQNQPPSKKELAYMRIPLQVDMYGKLLTSVKWEKGGGTE